MKDQSVAQSKFTDSGPSTKSKCVHPLCFQDSTFLIPGLFFSCFCYYIITPFMVIYSSWFTEGFVFEDLTCLKCEAGWEQHGGNCYYFSTSKSSWTDSRRSCTDLGSDLVKIDSREEQIRLRFLMEDDEDKFWIGLTDSGEEDEWLWVDGSPLDESLSFWGYGQPDDLGVYDLPGADCVRMGQKDRYDLKCWYDRGCDYPQKSICEKTAAAGV
uniref:C-type lectin domain-containing protein n=1 Tax=Poecilia mexicana TaxID=48701 RepID=A0A3B3XKC1_9TELE